MKILFTRKFDEMDYGMKFFQGFINCILILFYAALVAGIAYLIAMVF